MFCFHGKQKYKTSKGNWCYFPYSDYLENMLEMPHISNKNQRVLLRISRRQVFL